MIGTNTEKDFKLENYEEFYEHHFFDPIPVQFAYSVHEVVPRFGWAYDEVEKLEAKTLLDLGCLDGSFALTVAKQLGLEVTGIDLTKDGVSIATERAKDFNGRAQFHQGFAEDWLEKFAKEGRKFDIVTFFEVIEHVEDVQRLIKLIDKVLAPGGSVLVSTPSYESPLFGADDEQNKCHIRLYTTAEEDYEQPNKYGNVRKATSIHGEIGKDRIQSVSVHNHLINVRYI